MTFNLIFDFGHIFTIIGFFGALYYFIFQFITNNKDVRKSLIDTLQERKVLTLYRDILNKLLSVLDHFFGNPLSFKAFGMCFTLALIYPILFFVGAYSLGNGSGEFAGQVMLAKDTSYRPILLISLLAFFFFIYFSLKYENKIAVIITRKLKFLFSFSSILSEHVYRILVALLATSIMHIYIEKLTWFISLFMVFGYIFPATAVAVATTFTLTIAGAGSFLIVAAVATIVAHEKIRVRVILITIFNIFNFTLTPIITNYYYSDPNYYDPNY